MLLDLAVCTCLEHTRTHIPVFSCLFQHAVQREIWQGEMIGEAGGGLQRGNVYDLYSVCDYYDYYLHYYAKKLKSLCCVDVNFCHCIVVLCSRVCFRLLQVCAFENHGMAMHNGMTYNIPSDEFCAAPSSVSSDTLPRSPSEMSSPMSQ